jgi:hypothetical protein
MAERYHLKLTAFQNLDRLCKKQIKKVRQQRKYTKVSTCASEDRKQQQQQQQKQALCNHFKYTVTRRMVQ